VIHEMKRVDHIAISLDDIIVIVIVIVIVSVLGYSGSSHCLHFFFWCRFRRRRTTCLRLAFGNLRVCAAAIHSAPEFGVRECHTILD
jgi:hypothetical protein